MISHHVSLRLVLVVVVAVGVVVVVAGMGLVMVVLGLEEGLLEPLPLTLSLHPETYLILVVLGAGERRAYWSSRSWKQSIYM